MGRYRGKVVVISGIRDLAKESWDTVDEVMAKICKKKPAEIIFGGADGTDTRALISAATHRKKRTKLTIIVPGKLSQQPYNARIVAGGLARSHKNIEVVEMGLPMQPSAFPKRNTEMVSRGDSLVAFTDGRSTGGTKDTTSKAEKKGIPVKVIHVHSDPAYRKRNYHGA